MNFKFPNSSAKWPPDVYIYYMYLYVCRYVYVCMHVYEHVYVYLCVSVSSVLKESSVFGFFLLSKRDEAEK